MAIPKVGVKLIKVNPPFQATSNLLVLFNDCRKNNTDLKMQICDLIKEEIDDSFKVRAIYTSLKLIEEFHNNFATIPSNVEIFSDINAYLELLPTRNYPKIVVEQYETVSRQLKTNINERKLEYVVMAALKPKALRLYEPKIVEM